MTFISFVKSGRNLARSSMRPTTQNIHTSGRFIFPFLNFISRVFHSAVLIAGNIRTPAARGMSSKSNTRTKKNSRKRYPVFIDPGYSKRKVFICDFDHNKKNVPEPDFKNLNKNVSSDVLRQLAVLYQMNCHWGRGRKCSSVLLCVHQKIHHLHTTFY